VRLATIDIGTNTTLLLVAETSGSDVRVLAERAEITRLGRGIGADGGLGRPGIERTLAVLTDYAAVARAHGASINAIGTEGLRRAHQCA
jgi:exopolyphosphatase/guanosine-5'-triphosphate,3'-diphosphate pyrophosphatase